MCSTVKNPATDCRIYAEMLQLLVNLFVVPTAANYLQDVYVVHYTPIDYTPFDSTNGLGEQFKLFLNSVIDHWK